VTQRQVETAFNAVLRSGRVGSWTLDGEPLGRGAFGVTYQAHKTDLDGTRTRAAIKLLMPTGGYDVAGFTGEVRVLRTLRSLYLPRVLEGGQESTKAEGFKVLWFASELITGKTLQAEVLGETEQRPEPLSELLWLEVAHDMLSAIETVHAAGLVHLDLKPDNVMLVARKAMLIDFGLASLVGDVSSGIAGAWGWFSPEQLDGRLEARDFEPAVDLFKAGLTLYFAATGRRPWDFDPRPQVTPASEQRDRMRVAPDLSVLSPVQLDIIAPLLAFDPVHRGTAAKAVAKTLDSLPETSGRHTDESRARAKARKRSEADAAARAIEQARLEEREKAAKLIAAERAQAEQLARADEREQSQHALAAERERVNAAVRPVENDGQAPQPPASIPSPGGLAHHTAHSVEGAGSQSIPRRWTADRIATIALLVLGSLSTLFVISGTLIYALNPKLSASSHVAAWIMGSSHVVLLAGAYWFGLRVLRRRRLAFWIPLAAGAVASVIFVVCILAIGSTSP
jgi:hypothetical protein